MAKPPQTILKRHGRVDILVNSAGINHPKRNFRNVSVEGWDQIVAINLSGMFYCVPRGAARHARAQGRPGHQHLVVGGRYASTLTGPGYNATKHAVVALTESINMEECANGIRATSILPGEVATPILEKRPVPPPPEERAHAAGRGPRQDHPVRRHAAAARLRERAHHQPDLEPVLPRRAGVAPRT